MPQDAAPPLPPAGEDLVARARAAFAKGQIDEAAALCETALARDEKAAPALHLAGQIAYRRGDSEAAIILLGRAVAAAPMVLPYQLSLADAYRMSWHLDDALRIAQAAAVAWPNQAGPHTVLAFVQHERGDLDAAIASLRRAVALKPDDAPTHLRLGQVLLTRAAPGDWAPGWAEYEWRYRLPGVAPLIPRTDKPLWRGERLDGTLLLIGDQGYGDVIQFARYIPQAAARCRDLAIGCSEAMAPLLAQLPGGARHFQKWADMPPFAAYLPLSSLPRVLGTEPETIPTGIPYLRADEARAQRWDEALRQVVPKHFCRIGIVWAGRPTHPNDRRRSLRLRQLLPLAALRGLALVSLQKDQAEAQADHFTGLAPLIRASRRIADFADTLAVIATLDLVVTVDTAVAHLAAAAGKPVWLLLPFSADWRWGMKRGDSPWYPTMRLFRQPAPGRWSPAIDAVARELRLLLPGA